MNTSPIIQVQQAMNDRFIICDGLETVAAAIEKIKETGVSTIIVEKRNDNDEYGAVFLSDIAKKVIATDRSPERVNLYEIMTKPVLSVLPDMDVRYCARLFEQFGISRAPVIKDHNILGMISYSNIALISGNKQP
ncbi:CBS domain-containing protein [Thalassotalea crassostreae]|uniref:CBS domain-containing protein n=1 Tax=Thalassotalea crassostreae TaxID=1763536 RepID=UPI0008388109|nr:CBS domain-containing protein [Thalassotalea crassostreae]